ncbi:MAG: DUF2029 domain-containing protein [Proteobacteria bacterium]|nr:DUF2029 domain-containing protein [Pseudomonadota bacterium]
MKKVNSIPKGWYIFWLAGAVVCFGHGLIEFYRRLDRGTDLNCAYFAAKAINAGHDIFTGCSGYIYPPFFAFMLTPLTLFTPETAKCIWLVITLLLLFASLYLGFKLLAQAFQLQYTVWQAIAVCSLAVLFTYQSIMMELMQGQNDILSLAAIVFSLFFLKSLPFFSGSLLGLAAGIKYQGVIFLPWLLLRGRWQAALGLVAGFAMTVFLPALKLGFHNNFQYWARALAGLKGITHSADLPLQYAAHMPSILWISNISLTDGVIRIFLDQGWSIANAIALLAGIGLVLFLWIWERFRQNNIPFLWRNDKQFGVNQETAITIIEWSILLLGLLMFSPEVVRRHLLILLLVNLFSAVLVLFKSRSIKRSLMITLIIVNQIGLLIRYPFTGHSILNHWGLPGASLLPELLIVLIGGLALYRDSHFRGIDSELIVVPLTAQL